MKFAVIGQPIAQSLSPVLHSEMFHQLGIDATYCATEVSENELPHILQRVKTGEIDGLNVTIPHKSSVMDFLDEINPRAQKIGAVNCVYQKNDKLIGNNTDWFGFSMALRKNDISVAEKEVLVLGAGGVARAVIFALKQAGARQIRVFNRTPNRAQILADEIVLAHPFENIENFVKPDSIIINCTSVGMASNDSLMLENLFSGEQIIVDTIYAPEWTQFRKFGDRAGAKTLGGLDMFIFQGIQSLELWLGKRILEDLNLEKIRKKLAEKNMKKHEKSKIINHKC